MNTTIRPATRKEAQILAVYRDLIKAGLSQQEAVMGATERGTLMDLSRLEDLLTLEQKGAQQ